MKKLKRLPAGELLLCTFGTLCAILLIIGGFFFFSLRSIERGNRLQQSRTWIKMDLLDDMELNVEQLQAEVLRQVLTSDAGEIKRLDQIIRNLDQSNSEESADYQRFATAEKERQLYERVMRMRRGYWEQTDSVLEFCLVNRITEATELILSKQAPAYDQLLTAIKELTDYTEVDARETATATTRSISEIRTIGDALIGLTILMALGTGFSVARVGRQLKEDNRVLQMEATGREAVDLAVRLNPDIVVMDLSLPGLNGLEATRQIRKQCPETEVLAFTGIEEEKLIHQMFEAGSRGYILKTDSRASMQAALVALSQHKSHFTTQVGEVLFAKFLHGKENVSTGAEPGRLTRREREVVQLIAEGQSNKEVGATLGISAKTAETHRSAVMKKLGLDCVASLVRYAIRNHIIAA